jgi:hypothetical protein
VTPRRAFRLVSSEPSSDGLENEIADIGLAELAVLNPVDIDRVEWLDLGPGPNHPLRTLKSVEICSGEVGEALALACQAEPVGSVS